MYIQDTNGWANRIKKDRNQLLKAIDKQEITKQTVQKQSSDPWLSKRQIQSQVQDLTEKENQFQKRMCFLFDEILKFDEYIVVELKRLFERYSSEQSRYSQTVVVRMFVSTTIDVSYR